MIPDMLNHFYKQLLVNFPSSDLFMRPFRHCFGICPLTIVYKIYYRFWKRDCIHICYSYIIVVISTIYVD